MMFFTTISIAVALIAPLALAGDVAKFDQIPFFDFTDEYYLANGVDPSFLMPGRVQAASPIAVQDVSPDPDFFRDVRVLLTIPGWDHSGHPVYISVFGEFGIDGFTDDAAGVEAREIADKYPLYIFPCAGEDPLSPFCKRQNDIIPLNDGYFSGDPLGLWLLVFVHYTDAAFNTPEGVAALAELEAENGLDLDGTPYVKRLGELEDLEAQGFVEFLLRPEEEGRWSVCPAFKDPRGGAVAANSFLAAAVDVNMQSAPTDFELVCEWECLRDTGDWCDDECVV